ncbi:Right handed beta helix region [Maribacter sedimenticola]|uniref:Right handed beta helix region n=1 Tax=Maribacter sedimenticola TaxID=228956 RepID=A0ABY1SG60_9FLAO|nr:hypothetical protein [Maribacter sedimenticola]SNR44466.1 Right handed beta helix region [Maribacter sedimenticola]
MRVNFLIVFSAIIALIFTTSCRKNFEYSPSMGQLTFSKDTVFLDTVFTNIGSSTYTLKVYNRTKEDMFIPEISLRNGADSYYRLNVDGVAGKTFDNIPLYAQDSLYILIETTIEIKDNSNEIIYTDAILFDQSPFQQSVELITLAKDAIFLHPNNWGSNANNITLYTDENGDEVSVNGFELSEDSLHFTANRPYVIYGYAIVPDEKELQIDAGARVYFHNNSGLVVSEKARITINGKLSDDKERLENQVIFEGDRLEPAYNDMPGQWGTIWISKGSIGNTIDYLTIKNAQIGLFIEGEAIQNTESLVIRNSQVYNNGQHNIWAKQAIIIAENLVLGGAGSTSLQIENGGHYNFTHCTIANYWNKGFRIVPTLTVSNSSRSNPELHFDLVRLDFKNSIIDGNTAYELELTPSNDKLFNFSFLNCHIQYTQDQLPTENGPLYDFLNTDYYSNIYTGGNLDYFKPSSNGFRIGLDSYVIGKGDQNIANNVPNDLLGTSRTLTSDLGAYQAIMKETSE